MKLWWWIQGARTARRKLRRRHGVSFFERPFTNHADQKNYAASRARNDWIFLLDADEELSSELRQFPSGVEKT